MISDGSASNPRRKPPKTSPAGLFPGNAVVPFESEDLPYIKHHGIRALCGLLMDRHSACSLCPFSGDPEPMATVLVNIIAQTGAESGNPLVAFYFSKATEVRGDNMEVVRDWATRVGYAESTPSRKAVVNLLDNGNYHAVYGHIANPTEGDYSSGTLDHSQPRIAFRCGPRAGLRTLAGLGEQDHQGPGDRAGTRVHPAASGMVDSRQRPRPQHGAAGRGPDGRGQPQPTPHTGMGNFHARNQA